MVATGSVKPQGNPFAVPPRGGIGHDAERNWREWLRWYEGLPWWKRVIPLDIPERVVHRIRMMLPDR